MYNHRDFAAEDKLRQLCTTDYPLLSREKKEIDKYSKEEILSNIEWYYKALLGKTFNVTTDVYKYTKACLFYLISTNIGFLDAKYYITAIERILDIERIRKAYDEDLSNAPNEVKLRDLRNKALENEKFINKKRLTIIKKPNRQPRVVVRPSMGFDINTILKK